MNLRGVYFLFLGLTVATKAEEPCMGKDNTFTVKLDLFAGELGEPQQN